MTAMILGLACIVLAAMALALQRLYSVVPARELKRLASRNDYLARALYRPVAYGSSLRLLLWIVFGLTLSGGVVLLVQHITWWAACLLLIGLTGVLFTGILPMRLTRHSAQFATLFSALLTWILQRAHNTLDVVNVLFARFRELDKHSSLYEKEDLLRLLNQQKEQADNRMMEAELELAERTLRFSEKQAADIVLPYQKANLVNAGEAIGPVLLDQLHKYGQSSFLVYKDNPDNIVGSLAMRDAITAKQGGRIFDLVRSDLAFVHEDFSLPEVLAAFQKTGQRLVAVVNNGGEYTGSITLDVLLAELLGEAAESTSLSYENKAEIVAYQARPKQVAQTEISPEAAKDSKAPDADPEAAAKAPQQDDNLQSELA